MNVLLRVPLISGGTAVYDVQPQHVSKTEWVRNYGIQLWHEMGGTWYETHYNKSNWIKVDCEKTLRLLDKVPMVDDGCNDFQLRGDHDEAIPYS